ncbi:MAG: dihydrolipoyl dehydrogenase [Nevskiales bacterium]
MSNNYDVIVIGAGPAGYVAAIRCAQLGMNTACVDQWVNAEGQASLGGTCLNVGCIPSKALLESSELYHRAQHEFSAHGLSLGDVSMDIAKMQERRAGIVSSLTGGIAGLFKSNGVTAIAGHARVQGSGKVEVSSQDGKTEELSAKNIIIAAGSEPSELKVAPFDHERILDSSDALELKEVPGKLGIIGAGIIGLELGSVWSRLGAEVTLIETVDSLLPMTDKQIAREAAKQFKKQGLDIRLGARVLSAKADENGVAVEYTQNDEKKNLNFDKVIVAVGRRPVTADIATKAANLRVDQRGFIPVDDNFRTNLPNVYAIGDVIGGMMLAHKGSEEGVVLAEQLAGQASHMNYNCVPSVIYTNPEIAWVGKTEEQAKADGIECQTGSFPFAASGRAKAMEQTDGLVKIITDARTDEIIGAHMIGPYVSELIAELVLAMEYRASAEDVARTIHAHPALAEAVHEAALAVDNRAIHIANRKRK